MLLWLGCLMRKETELEEKSEVHAIEIEKGIEKER